MKDQKLDDTDARVRCEEQKKMLLAAIQADQMRKAEREIYESRPIWAAGLNERQLCSS